MLSTNIPTRIGAGTSCILAVALLAAGPGSAAETTFDPRIALSTNYTDNVRYVEGTDDASDTSTSLRVTLPVERQTLHSSVLFRFDVGGSKFSEFSSLDNLESRMLLDYNVATSRVSTVSVRARYGFTQDQADPLILEDELDPDPFLAVRTKRKSYSLTLGYGRAMGRHWKWNSSIGASGIDHSVIGDFDPQGSPELIPEDKTGYRASTRFTKQVSEKTSIGGKYTYGVTDLDINGEDELHRVQFTVDTDVSRRVALVAEVGGYSRSNDDLDESDSGLDANLSIRFNEALTAGPVKFGFGAGVVPSRGGSLEGTSSNRAVFVSMSGVRTRPVDWAVVARYSQRVPDLIGQSERDTTSLSARTEFEIHRNLGISVGARWVEQASDDPLQPDNSFYRATAGLVYRPLGNTAIAGK